MIVSVPSKAIVKKTLLISSISLHSERLKIPLHHFNVVTFIMCLKMFMSHLQVICLIFKIVDFFCKCIDLHLMIVYINLNSWFHSSFMKRFCLLLFVRVNKVLIFLLLILLNLIFKFLNFLVFILNFRVMQFLENFNQNLFEFVKV